MYLWICLSDIFFYESKIAMLIKALRLFSFWNKQIWKWSFIKGFVALEMVLLLNLFDSMKFFYIFYKILNNNAKKIKVVDTIVLT